MLAYDMWRFLWGRKKFWLMPVVFFLLLLGGLIIALEGYAIAPLVYTIF